jgi:hypothetical protein
LPIRTILLAELLWVSKADDYAYVAVIAAKSPSRWLDNQGSVMEENRVTGGLAEGPTSRFLPSGISMRTSL